MRANGAYKTCGTWCVEFFDDNKQWQSLTFKDIRNKSDAEKRLTLFISDRERGQLKLPRNNAYRIRKDRLIILTALFTGMRLNEVLNLTWDDIDFGKGIIHVFQSKTSKIFDIPLSDCLRTALEAYRTHPAGSRVFEAREIARKVVVEYSTYFSGLFKGMGIHGFTFHNLRHTFASIMQSDLGIGAVTVMGMTGLGMLQKYSPTGLDSKQRAIQALNSHVLTTGRNVSQAVGQ